MNKNFPKLALSALLMALGLVTVSNIGCHDDDDAHKKTKTGSQTDPTVPKTTYFELKFDGRASTDANAQGAIDAIGKNGSGSRIYFGTNTQKRIYTMTPAGVVVAVVTQASPVHDDSAGKADFDAALDATKIKRIVPGQGTLAVASVTGLTGFPSAVKGGIMRMDNDTVTGAWDAKGKHLPAGDQNNEISALAVIGTNAVAFFANKASTGSHVNLAAPPAVGVGGPATAPGTLNVIVTAATSAGNDLYLASDGKVNKFPVPNAAALAGPINFAANVVMDDADLRIVPGTANSNISAIAVVGGDLLVGLNGGNTPNTGGVAILKADGTKVKKIAPVAAHAMWDVKDIAVGSDNKTAVISTTKGLLFYFDGKLVKITNAGLAGLTVAAASDTTPVAITNAPVPAAGGPGFVRPDLDHTNVGATHVGNTWYIATDNAGIFKVSMEEKQK